MYYKSTIKINRNFIFYVFSINIFYVKNIYIKFFFFFKKKNYNTIYFTIKISSKKKIYNRKIVKIP